MNNRHSHRKIKKRKVPSQELILRVSEIGAGGDGVAHHNDMRIFVPKTMEGDVVKVRIEGCVKDGCHAYLLSIEIPSPSRKTPFCRHFENCGGCSLQHLGEEAYRAWKIEQVKTTLKRAEIIPEKWEVPIFIPAATRRRTTLSVQKLSEKKIILGYQPPRSHIITDISECGILDPALESLILKLKPYLLHLAPMYKKLDITIQKAGGVDMLLTGEWREGGDFTLIQHEMIAAMMQTLSISRLSIRKHDHAPCEILLTRADIIKDFGAIKTPLPPAAFLQASDEAEDILCNLMMQHISMAQNVADLFCGCGTFAGRLLRQGKDVVAIDGDSVAMDALISTRHPNVQSQTRNLFKEPLTTIELNAFDAVIFDPPRAGARAQCENLAYSNVPKVVAVSCNSATFARDAKILIEEGGYHLQVLYIVDQFMWSPHCEIVAFFSK